MALDWMTFDGQVTLRLELADALHRRCWLPDAKHEHLGEAVAGYDLHPLPDGGREVFAVALVDHQPFAARSGFPSLDAAMEWAVSRVEGRFGAR